MNYEYLLATGWGALGNELQNANLVDDMWYKRPNKYIKNASEIDRGVLELFLLLEDRVLKDGYQEAEMRSKKIREKSNILDEEQAGQVNTILLGLHLIHFWAEKTKGPLAKLAESKSLRLIDMVKPVVIEKSGLDTSKNSYRCADDLLRIVEGRAVLPKEVRDKNAARYLKKTTV